MTDKKPFYFEDYADNVGNGFRTVSHSMEKEEIIEFAKKWDPQPFHIDEAAADASIFGGLTACSAHLFSVCCSLSQNWEIGVVQMALSSLGFDNVRMIKPAYAGDELTCIVYVEEARPSRSKNDRGIVTNRCVLVNQHEEPVFEFTCAFLMQIREHV